VIDHDCRTRPDPFEGHWPEIEARLRDNPELETEALFELLQQAHPGRYEEGQLRTPQRRVKHWRAAHGHDREVVLGLDADQDWIQSQRWIGSSAVAVLGRPPQRDPRACREAGSLGRGVWDGSCVELSTRTRVGHRQPGSSPSPGPGSWITVFRLAYPAPHRRPSH